jgi:hypothetical protein
MNSKIKVITHALMSQIGVVTKSSKNLVNIRDLLGLDYVIIKITFSFALAMLAISIAPSRKVRPPFIRYCIIGRCNVNIKGYGCHAASST